MPFRRRTDYELDRLPDDEILAYAVAAREAGDRKAMEDALAILIFRRYDDLVRRARLKVPTEDAEDVAARALSDAALAAFEGASEGEFWKLVSRVLQRRVSDYWEKRERSPDTAPLPEEHADDEDVHGKTAAVSSDPTTAVDAQDVIDEVLGRLNDVHRRVVELSIEGFSAQEVSARLNAEDPDLDPPMSVDNVHQITSRFRRDLREALEGRDQC
jgi:DNA-directed RNA polymerase specialized sigma24 family protein